MLARDFFLLLTALFVLLTMAIAALAERPGLAIYALSFWHYLVYVLAFLWRSIALERFIRDSVLLKAISLAAFALVLLTVMPNVFALIAMAAGFGLNIAAARALGKERTYYGYELAALPPKRVTSFPYSVTAHPMLIGAMLAYGGTLLDATFRQDWWPLGVLHVVLNLLIIVNEAYGRESRAAGMMAAIGGLAVAAGLLLLSYGDIWPHALAVTLLSGVFGIVIIRRYG